MFNALNEKWKVKSEKWKTKNTPSVVFQVDIVGLRLRVQSTFNICSKQNLELSKGAEHRNQHITVLCTFGTYLNGFSTNIEVLCTYKYHPTWPTWKATKEQAKNNVANSTHTSHNLSRKPSGKNT